MNKKQKICEVCGAKFHGTYRGGKRDILLCGKHLHHMHKYKKIRKRTTRDKNQIIKQKDYGEMCLYNKHCKLVAKALIDIQDIEIVKQYKWGSLKKNKSIYIKTDLSQKKQKNKKRKTLYLANLILGKRKGFQIDHISGNSLDNRRSNLRFVTQQQNLMNRHFVKGYSKEKVSGLWHTYIGINNKRITLGRFKTEKEAIKIRKNAEKKYYGEFARQQSLDK